MADTPAQAALRAAFNSRLSLSATLDELPSDFLDEFYPAGEFIICAGTTLPPRTLLCNGAAVSRTTYSRLFTAIGTKYGAGDGSTTFNLPNLDGRVLQGTSDTSNVGQYLEAQLPKSFKPAKHPGLASSRLGGFLLPFCFRTVRTYRLIKTVKSFTTGQA